MAATPQSQHRTRLPTLAGRYGGHGLDAEQQSQGRNHELTSGGGFTRSASSFPVIGGGSSSGSGSGMSSVRRAGFRAGNRTVAGMGGGVGGPGPGYGYGLSAGARAGRPTEVSGGGLGSVRAGDSTSLSGGGSGSGSGSGNGRSGRRLGMEMGARSPSMM